MANICKDRFKKLHLMEIWSLKRGLFSAISFEITKDIMVFQSFEFFTNGPCTLFGQTNHCGPPSNYWGPLLLPSRSTRPVLPSCWLSDTDTDPKTKIGITDRFDDREKSNRARKMYRYDLSVSKSANGASIVQKMPGEINGALFYRGSSISWLLGTSSSFIIVLENFL